MPPQNLSFWPLRLRDINGAATLWSNFWTLVAALIALKLRCFVVTGNIGWLTVPVSRRRPLPGNRRSILPPRRCQPLPCWHCGRAAGKTTAKLCGQEPPPFRPTGARQISCRTDDGNQESTNDLSRNRAGTEAAGWCARPAWKYRIRSGSLASSGLSRAATQD